MYVSIFPEFTCIRTVYVVNWKKETNLQTDMAGLQSVGQTIQRGATNKSAVIEMRGKGYIYFFASGMEVVNADSA